MQFIIGATDYKFGAGRKGGGGYGRTSLALVYVSVLN